MTAEQERAAVVAFLETSINDGDCVFYKPEHISGIMQATSPQETGV
jgi:hypothetical protein